MGMLKEFRDFAVKGNAVDMAVGIIIGGAFGKIVSSLVNDIVMPPIGLITGKVDFSKLFVALDGKTYPTIEAAARDSAPIIAYGSFINAVIQFFIVAACIFALVKVINQLKRAEAEKPAPKPEPTPEEKLLVEIRDLLKK